MDSSATLQDYFPEEMHPVFCNGLLLETIQMSRLFTDSKTFVDMKLKLSPKRVLEKFHHLLEKKNNQPLTTEELKHFVENNFDPEGTELEHWTPTDWRESPSILDRLTNPKLIGLAKCLNNLWLELSRKIIQEVEEEPSLYSIIYVPHGFVVPGGRFREFYYWDTYWIVKALLHCDMVETVKGIIENFLIMVDKYGLVPNGGRIYYIKRSQPPVLTLMMTEYINKTGDVDFLADSISTLARELKFWEKRRSVTVIKNDSGTFTEAESYELFTFGSDDTGPRPESYREDVELSHILDADYDPEEFFHNMKAGAESGWDYSTRWMIDHKRRNRGGLKCVKTSYIVPVDLNSLMYMNYRNLADFYSMLNDSERATRYRNKAFRLKEAIYHVLWNMEDSMWYDYDLLNHIPRKYFYPSNLFPLWAECYESCDRAMVADSAIKYLKRTGTIYCNGGVPTSLVESGQQWDFPNAWPPLQHVLVDGLLKTENEEARKIALTIARRYTMGTMFSDPEGKHQYVMFEKYNASQTGIAGGGGEYEVQTGFGWSNGVVIEFMHIFGDELLADDGVDKEYERENPVDLVTQFDMSQSKSLLVTRASSSALSLRDLVTMERIVAEEDENQFDEDDNQTCFDVDSDDEGLMLNAIRGMTVHDDEDVDEYERGGSPSEQEMSQILNRVRRISRSGLPRRYSEAVHLPDGKRGSRSQSRRVSENIKM